jgi:signal transduction histidine kinase
VGDAKGEQVSMWTKSSLWFWRGVWAASALIVLGLLALYTWLPADGATGDLASFTAQGFRVQRLLEERAGGLRVGDLIVRAGGHTLEEWLAGASRGAEWRTGGVVTYQVLREGQLLTLQIRLSPVPFRSIVSHWALQLIGGLVFLFLGALLFWKRPRDRAARLLMLFCIVMALQYWGDAYNIQYATLPWRWPFWLHVLYEHAIFSLCVATGCYFALVFPLAHPLVRRFPRLIPLILYGAQPLAIAGAMALSPNRTASMWIGSDASWIVAIAQIGFGVSAGFRSLRNAKDPVTRAQIHWIFWSGSLGVAVLVPGYVIPLIVTGRPPFPHSVAMALMILQGLAFAVAVLRYRLFDIGIITNRSLVYGTLTVLLAGLYLSLVRSLTLAIQVLVHREDNTLVVFIATLTVALAFAPLRQRVQALIDRTFYRAKLDYQRLLPEIGARLATCIVPDQLAHLLTVDLPRQLQIASATLAVLGTGNGCFVPAGDGDSGYELPSDHPLATFLRDQGGPVMRLQPPAQLPAEAQTFLDRDGIELCIPLIVGTELVGLYNLGPKLSGRVYNHEEVRLLYLLGQQAAIAVENARLYQEVQRQAEELAAAVAQLRQLDRLKNEFIQNVSHELRSPMTIVRGYAEVLDAGQLGELSPDQQQATAIIKRRVRMLSEMVEDIMLILEAEANPPQPQPVLLSELTQSVVEDFQVEAGRAELALHADIVPAPPVKGSPTYLRRVLDNLVANAIKFTPAGGAITVRVRRRGDQVVLEVSDTGIGIPPDQQERVFERFYQVDGSIHRRYRGAGLGLALVKEIVEVYGGRVAVESKAGEGTTFAVTLPIYEE